MQDFFKDFGDLDGYIENHPSSKPLTTSKDKLDLPDIPPSDIQDLSQLASNPAERRRDKPAAYIPRPSRRSANKDNASESSSASQLELGKQSQVSLRQKTPNAAPTERTGSINKISTPNTVSLSFIESEVAEQDQDLIELADTYDVFTLSKIADYQVVSPTPAEFIAQYYRLANNMIAKVALNQLVDTPNEISSMWFDGVKTKTLNLSGSTVYSYDDIYRYCVQDSVIDSLRAKYKSKQVHFTQMQTHEIMGAGNGISSAQQASYYLEKMATASFSSTIGMLTFRKNMIRVRDWFENTLKVSNSTRSSILSLIQTAITKSSEAEAEKYRDDNDVFVVQHHRCILFAKKLLNRHSNIQLADSQLQISALVFLMSGVSEAKPNLSNIGFQNLYDGLEASPALVDSLVQLSYESHRHCYPINELSHL